MSRTCPACGYDPGFDAVVCPKCGSPGTGERGRAGGDRRDSTRMESGRTAGACFFVRKGPDIGQQFPIGKVSRIGRDRDCDVALADSRVSREHARVKLVDGQFIYQDLQTSNGSFLLRNGREEPLRGPHILRDSDELLVGGSVLRFIVFVEGGRS